jgi:hypothetical protein
MRRGERREIGNGGEVQWLVLIATKVTLIVMVVGGGLWNEAKWRLWWEWGWCLWIGRACVYNTVIK